ncbi:MAG: twin-arginine translocase TatA/TatE family subunit [Pseudomonadota bacterium]
MSIGIWQILIVVVLVFLLFGAGRLPRVMEDIAKGIKSFKKGLNEEDNALLPPADKKVDSVSEKVSDKKD